MKEMSTLKKYISGEELIVVEKSSVYFRQSWVTQKIDIFCYNTTTMRLNINSLHTKKQNEVEIYMCIDTKKKNDVAYIYDSEVDDPYCEEEIYFNSPEKETTPLSNTESRQASQDLTYQSRNFVNHLNNHDEFPFK